MNQLPMRRSERSPAGRRHGTRVAIGLLFASTLARAQSGAPAAEALFNDGRAAMGRKDYATACTKFRESDRLDPAPGTQLNLANCEEQRGRVATASLLFQQVLRRLDPADRRIDVARRRIEALGPRVPHVRMVLRPGQSVETRVRLGELEFSSPSFGSLIPIDPGKHEVVVVTPGLAEQRSALDLQEGEVVELSVPFGLDDRPAAQVGAGTAPASVPAASDEILGLDRKTAAYVAGGVGVVGVVVGTVAGIAGLSQEEKGDANCSDATRTCNQVGFDANASARTLAVVSTLGFVVGVVGLGTGGYLFLTAQAPPAKGSAAISFPVVGWRGSW